MIEAEIPGFGKLEFLHAVFDYNGTLAIEGKLISGLVEALNALSENVHIHIVTGDTYGIAKYEVEGINCQLTILPATSQAQNKKKYVETLGSKKVVAIGNGRNDRYMLKVAALGIAVVGKEGAAVETILSSDILMPDIGSTLNILTNPKQLIATLRS